MPLSQSVGEAVYWLVWLFFLPAILGALRLTSLMVPVQNLVNAILLYLPKLVAAALILVVGWFVARIVQRIVANLLRAIGTDRLGERMGMAQVLGKQTLSGVIGLVVYILILVPVLIAALDALQIASLTTPLSNMLSTMLAALPRIFAAALALVIAYFVARLVAKLVTTLLAGIGFNALPSRLGIGSAPAEGQRTASEIVGWVVLVAIMVFAVLGAASLLGWTALALLLSEFVVFAWHIIVGLIVFGLGLWLADVIAKMVMESNLNQKRLVAMLARVAIVALSLAIALRQMGLANEIINLAFGLLLGAIAVAAGHRVRHRRPRSGQVPVGQVVQGRERDPGSACCARGTRRGRTEAISDRSQLLGTVGFDSDTGKEASLAGVFIIRRTLGRIYRCYSA